MAWFLGSERELGCVRVGWRRGRMFMSISEGSRSVEQAGGSEDTAPEEGKKHGSDTHDCCS